jgi:hypothetical protein
LDAEVVLETEEEEVSDDVAILVFVGERDCSGDLVAVIDLVPVELSDDDRVEEKETLGDIEAKDEGDVVPVAVPVRVADVDFDADVDLDSEGVGVEVIVDETDKEGDPDGELDLVDDFDGREEGVGTEVLLDEGEAADVNVDVVVDECLSELDASGADDADGEDNDEDPPDFFNGAD